MNITKEAAEQMQERVDSLKNKKNHQRIGGFTYKETPVTQAICKGLVNFIQGNSYIEIPGLIPGLNGSDGLMRSHWSNVKKAKKTYSQIILSQNHNTLEHKGKVAIEYIGYKSILMDWDNFCSSFKHIGDCLKGCRVIKDDKPSIVMEFIPKQIKCKRKDQKVVIIIRDYNT